MGSTPHPQSALKVLAVTAAVLVGTPSQAALTNLTLDSGLRVSQDAATSLLWRSFDVANEGVQAGFRQATVADFDALLTNNGYTATGRLPSGLAQQTLNSGGVQASYYVSNGLSAMSVVGAHSYDNNVSFGETHYFIMGQVQSDDGYWVGATVDNYVARRCGPGDPGYQPYETITRYCGGTSSTHGYLGPSAGTEFQASLFNHVDNISVNNKPLGYLMVRSVPEPTTFALMGLGLVGMACVRARRGQPKA